MSDRRVQTKAAPAVATKAASGATGGGSGFWAGAILSAACVIILSRLLTPTEGAISGETLWVAQLTFGSLLVWGYACFRNGHLSLALDFLDLSVALLVMGHMMAAATVLWATGDRRAALNMLWEWAAVGGTFFLTRRALESQAGRRGLILLLFSAAATLAVLGVWQHFWGYPKLIREYDALVQQWQQLQTAEPPADFKAAADRDAQIERLRGEFLARDIPTDPAALSNWEHRLKDSTEPIGAFALANTLAGVLAALLFLGLGVLVEAVRRGESRMAILPWAAACMLIAYCLLLTKSRTAFVGCLTAAGAWALTGWEAPLRHRRRSLAGPGLVLAGGGILIVAAWLSGGLDRLVFSESAKSLRYRFEYWAGAWRVISESPQAFLLGVGPGNFRQHYLLYKLPQASEEILDPHNMFLDVWANGGVMALAGLAGICICGCWSLAAGLVRACRQPAEGQSEPVLSWPAGPATQQANPELRIRNGERSFFRLAAPWPVVVGGTLAFVITSCGFGDVTGEAMLLFPVWLGFVLLFSTLAGKRVEVGSAALGAAFLALAVHLLGAGGVAMPAVTAVWLTIAALVPIVPPGPKWSVSTRRRTRLAPMVLAVPLALFVACLTTATGPVIVRTNSLAAGDAELYNHRRLAQSETLYRQGLAADGYSPEPPARLAMLAFERWRGRAGNTAAGEREFERAVDWQHQAIAQDPLNFGGYRILARLFWEKYERLHRPDDARRSAEAFDQALARYPNNPGLRADAAEAWSSAGQTLPAREAARKALELHEINRLAGHPDKLLPARRLERLKRIAGDNRDREPPVAN